MLKKYFKFFFHRYDIFGCFIEKCENLLKTSGILSFIQPTVFLNSKSFSKIREHIVFKNKILAINLLKDGIFSAIVPTMIFSIQKSNISNANIKVSRGCLEKFYYLNQKVFEKTEASVLNLELNENTEKFISKIKINTIQLGEIAKVSRAMNLGDYSKFLTDKDMSKNENYIKVLKGASIRKWIYNYENFYLLKNFDEFVSVGDLLVLKEPKLMMKRIGKFPEVCFDDTEIAALDTVYTIRLIEKKYNIKYILALLNSKFIGHIFRLQVPLKGDVFPEFRIFDLNKQIHIKNITEALQAPFVIIVDEIIAKRKAGENTKHLERLIDDMVYALYELTPEEIALVEGK